MDRFLPAFDAQFARLHEHAAACVRVVTPMWEKFFWQPRIVAAGAPPAYSCGEHLLRGAACVEQTFGGITSNLWDDPFEWTLPEALSTPALVAEYLDEVEATRRRGLSTLRTDADLLKEITAPSGELLTLFALLTDTLTRAAHRQGCAYATFRLFSDGRLPPV